jgi:hypothetical protein
MTERSEGMQAWERLVPGRKEPAKVGKATTQPGTATYYESCETAMDAGDVPDRPL